jgi:hypothetical protein
MYGATFQIGEARLYLPRAEEVSARSANPPIDSSGLHVAGVLVIASETTAALV